MDICKHLSDHESKIFAQIIKVTTIYLGNNFNVISWDKYAEFFTVIVKAIGVKSSNEDIESNSTNLEFLFSVTNRLLALMDVNRDDNDIKAIILPLMIGIENAFKHYGSVHKIMHVITHLLKKLGSKELRIYIIFIRLNQYSGYFL